MSTDCHGNDSGGFGVEPAGLRASARALSGLANQLTSSIGEPPVPSAGGTRGFTSAQAMLAAADAWQAEVGQLATVLRAAGDKLVRTAATYERADVFGAQGFRRILRGR